MRRSHLIPPPLLIPIAPLFSLRSRPVGPHFKFTILLYWSTKHTRPLPTSSFTLSLPQSSHVNEPTLCHSTSLVCNARSFPAYAILLQFVTLAICLFLRLISETFTLGSSAPLFHPFHFLACHRYYSPIPCPSSMSVLSCWSLFLFGLCHICSSSPSPLLPISELAHSHPVSPRIGPAATPSRSTYAPYFSGRSKTFWKSSKAKRSMAN
jgi:hypothetical protein